MDTKPEIKYINTMIVTVPEICASLAEFMGYSMAESIATGWHEKYNEFLLNMQNGEVVMFKRRTAGYWEANPAQLQLLK